MKTFVIGDIHGAHKALVQCLERSQFNKEEDRLVVLGDVADGWTEIVECFEELLTIKNLVYVRGNHDQWLKQWLLKGQAPDIWTLQGGKNTINSYLKHDHALWGKHAEFLKKTEHYFEDENNNLYVHGGIDPTTKAEFNSKQYLTWDRDLWDLRPQTCIHYNEVFVGHTSIWRFSHFPLKQGNVWFMDTGGGWEGKLTIMDVDTKKFWQSDLVIQLYPDQRGRN